MEIRRYEPERLDAPSDAEFDALTRLWEASVRATHRFLAPGDIDFFREVVRREALPGTELHVLRDAQGGFIAFAGTEGDKLEMLFVDPAHRGRGAGRCLVEHLVARGVRRVNVNEQNTRAAGFYARMGFRTVARDPFDATGRPYPILRLERE